MSLRNDLTVMLRKTWKNFIYFMRKLRRKYHKTVIAPIVPPKPTVSIGNIISRSNEKKPTTSLGRLNNREAYATLGRMSQSKPLQPEVPYGSIHEANILDEDHLAAYKERINTNEA